MKTQEHLTDWLRDAHGMEQQSIELLEKQARRLEHYPEMQARIRQHAETSKRQAERIAGCISRLDGSTSTTKSMTGKLMGNLSAMSSAMAEDEVVKNTLSDFAFENFEIACYRSLVEAAEVAGDMQTAQVCREILREEEEMAKWVFSQIPMITRAYLERDLADVEAKR